MKTVAGLDKAYQNFFIKTEAGEYFMNELTRLLGADHIEAEEKPELARDYVQRAKGVRQVIDHINSVCVERRASVQSPCVRSGRKYQ